MAQQLTYQEYISNLDKRIANLKTWLDDAEKSYKLMKDHPELFDELKRLAGLY